MIDIYITLKKKSELLNFLQSITENPTVPVHVLDKNYFRTKVINFGSPIVNLYV